MKDTKCPYCGKDMELGHIHRDRYDFKWKPDKSTGKLLGIPLHKGIRLTNLERGSITVYYCKKCNKMIFDAIE